MNKVFKVIVNKITSEKVVVSENATGAKKGDSRGMIKKIVSVSLMAGSLFGVVAAQTEHSLHDQYSPSKRTDHADGGVTYEALSNEKNHAIKIKDGGEHLLNNYNYSDTQIDKKLDFNESKKTKEFSELIEEGSLKVYKAEDWDRDNKKPKEGAQPLSDEEAKELNETGLPAQFEYKVQDKEGETFTFIDDSGVEREIVKKGINSRKYNKPVKKKVTTQEKIPDEPYYQLSFAEVTDGSIMLDTGNQEEIKWDFKDTRIKDSALFVADSTQSNKEATIIVSKNTNINVDFGKNKRVYKSHYEQPGEEITDVSDRIMTDFIHKVDPSAPPLVIEYYDDKKQLSTKEFTIASEDDFDAYNQFIIDQIRSNHLNQEEYTKLVSDSKVVRKVPKKTLYILHYKGDGVDYREYITEAHTNTEVNYIFSAAGEHASIEIEEGARLISEADYGSAQKKGGVLELKDKATGVDHGRNIVGSGGNVSVSSDASYTQKGTKVFGYDQVDGRSRDGIQLITSKSEEIDSGKYFNKGEIFSNNQNTFKVYSKNAELSNHGDMHFYSAHSEDASTLDNIEVRDSGTFINEKDGKITLGIGFDDVGNEIALKKKGGSNADLYFQRENVHNIVDISLSGSAENKGHMQIGIRPEKAKSEDEIFIYGVGINYSGTMSEDNSAINSATGVMDLGGEQTLGIRVAKGNGTDYDNAGNAGTINVFGRDSVGIMGLSDAVVHNKGKGVINVGNKHDQGDYRHIGMQIEGGARALLKDESRINLVGDNAIGVFARNGGKIDVSEKAAVLGRGDKNEHSNQTLFWTSGYDAYKGNSSVTFADGDFTFDLNAQKSSVFRVDGGATFEFDTSSGAPSQYTFNVHGDESRGFYVAESLTQVVADDSVVLNVLGEDATGFFVTSGAGTGGEGTDRLGKVELTQEAQISLKGKNSTAMTVDGNYYDLYNNNIAIDGKEHTPTVAHSSAQLNTKNVDTTQGAYGYKLINEGKLIHSGSIDFSDAENATGIQVNGGVLENQKNSNIVVNGVGIEIYQDNKKGLTSKVMTEGDIIATDGTAAIRMNENTKLTLSGEGAVEGAGKADGVLVHKGASLALSDANQLKVSGTEGSALHFQTANDAGTFELENASGKVLVSGEVGSDVAAITIEGEGANRDGVTGKSDFDSKVLNDIEIKVEEGRGGHAVVTNLAGAITIDKDTNLKIASEVGGSALKVTGESELITNSGTLSSASTEAPVIDARDLGEEGELIADNKGTIHALADEGLAFASTKKTHFANHTDADIKGRVQLGDQGNTLLLEGGSKGDRFISGEGDDLFILDGVVGTDASRDLFKQIDGGQGKDALTLQNKSHFIYQKGHAIDHINQLIVPSGNWFEMNGSNPILAVDQTNIEVGGTFSSVAGTLKSDISNEGLFAVGAIAVPNFKSGYTPDAPSDAKGPFKVTVDGDFHNKLGGSIDLSSRHFHDSVTTRPIGNVLTITGDYQGETGALIYMNTHWDNPGDAFGADSKSDRLIIEGKTVGNGATRVIPISRDTGAEAVIDGSIEAVADHVKNTLDVIETGGTYDGAFVGVAQTTGAGEVQLVRNNDNWRWTTNAMLHQPDPKPVDPADPADPNPSAPIYNKGVPGYAQLAKVNREMGLNQLGKLHDRMGELQTYVWDCCGGYADYYKQQKERYDKDVHPIWVRGEFIQLKEQGRERLGYDLAEGILQIGSDISFTMDEEKNHHHLGLMAGYSHGKVDFYDKFRAENGVVTSEKRTGKTDIDLFSIGAYSTWYRANGAYLDLVGQLSYSHNRYQDYGGNLSQNGYGMGLSAEIGRPFQIGSSNWLIEPQAQLMYQYAHLSSATDGPKRISGQSGSTLRGRLGARLAWNGDNGESHTNTFYASAHILHDFTGYKSKAKIGADRIEERYARTWGEVQLGAQIATSRSTYVYGSIGYQRALGGHKNSTHRSNDRSREGFKGYLGIRFNF